MNKQTDTTTYISMPQDYISRVFGPPSQYHLVCMKSHEALPYQAQLGDITGSLGIFCHETFSEHLAMDFPFDFPLKPEGEL